MGIYTVNLGSVLRRTGAKHPDRVALVSHEGHKLTYRQLDEASNRLANGLLKCGFKKGDHIATLSPNSNELLIAFWGILKIGAVVVPINVRLAEPEIEWILNHSDSSALFFSPDLAKTVDSIRPRLQAIRSDWLLSGSPSQEGRSFGEIIDQGGEEYPPAEVLGDDDAMIIYTAGTTGRPKGVILTHNTFLWNNVNWVHAGIFPPACLVLQAFPLYHVAAICNVLTFMYVGGTVFLKKAFDPKDCMETIQREGITRWGAAPTVFNMLLQLPDIKEYDTRSMALLGSGAAIMPTETSRKLRKVFPNAGLFDSYGMTEASGGITILTPEDFHRKVACVGRPLMNLELRVIDEQGEDVPAGQVGEIVFRGNNVMKGYYKDTEATKEAFQGGWFHSGDLGRFDEEGFLYIVDRKKDLIITGAENVYPREVEEVLYLHPKIAEAAVIGVPDPKWGEAIKAVIVLKQGEKAAEEEIIQFCRKRVAGFKCPKSVEFTQSLPKNAAGKILKRVLREKYGKR